ncbi:MAG: MFS transporter [Bacteroidota bacterium]|nr:MFS transporter [Bacteroidota bacterium]
MYNRKLVFAASCMGMLLFGIVLTSLGSILPNVVKTFNLNDIQTGALVTFLPIGLIIGSLFFGPLVDKYGYKYMLIICSAMVLIGFEGLALGKSYTMLQLSIFLIGLGGGAINGAGNALVADISEGSKGANLSLLGVFFGIGALGMPAILGLLSNYSYTSIIGIIGTFISLPILFFLTIRFPMPKQTQGFPLLKGFSLIKNPVLLILSFILFFESGLEGLMNNWTTSFMGKGFDISKEQALFALSFHVAGLTTGRLILGFLLKRFKEKNILYISFTLVLIASIIMINSTSYFSILIGLIILGFGFAATFPVILGFVGSKFSDLSGTAFSIALVIALTGNTLVNYFMGILSSSFGIKVLPIFLAICLIIMALLATTYFINYEKK